MKEPLTIEKSLDELLVISLKRKVPMQIVEARYLCGTRHAFHAGNLALRAHQEKRGRAKRIEMEIMLYLAGRRQIGEAIKSIGVKNRTKEVAIIAVGSSERAVREALPEVAKQLEGREDDTLLSLTDQKKLSLQELLEITNDELTIVTGGKNWKEGLLKCVMERGAMLDALKK